MEDTNLTEVLSASDPSAVLNEFLTEIANALREKKETTEPILASEFANEIRNLSSGLSFADYLATRENDLTNIFVKGAQDFVQAGINLIDWRSLNENYDSVQLNCLCYNNPDLISITMDDHNLIDKPVNASSLFALCEQLQQVQLLLNSLENFYQLFFGCWNLQQVVLKYYTSQTENVDSIPWYSGYMCSDCYSLLTIIFQSIDPNHYLMANTWLSRAYHFTGAQDDDYNPNGLRDGRIYVPDDMVNKLKVATGWSKYADVIYPLSEYVPEEE